jgi:hypothetical protein
MVNGTRLALVFAVASVALACSDDGSQGGSESASTGQDPDTAERVSVERFSAAAGMLQVRTIMVCRVRMRR